MPQLVELVLLAGEHLDEAVILQKSARQTGLRPDQISHIEIVKSSLDARAQQAVFRVRVEVYGLNEIFTPEPAILSKLKLADGKKKVLIVGAGPAGYFAALELIELGIKPIVLDRGKDVQARRRDLRALQQFGEVNPHSNYCFGEGGAGTYSDGKLYTRSVKRGNVHKSLKILVEHGAKSDILADAHPHIGSNKLPGVVQNIRATIQHYGGEIHFGQCVTDFILKNGKMLGVVSQSVENQKETEWLADAVVLATGHSARDIYKLLHTKNIRIEPKPFALGVRVEHPQSLIDNIQYKKNKRDESLPAASYSLVCQVENRGVFSFCMCPGGLIVPAATAPGEIVVNGMSMSRRDSFFANSGIVTAIEPEDLTSWKKHGVFAGMELQREVESRLFQAGDGSQKGPALRLPDFIAGKLSADLPASSYIPGLHSAPLFELLPRFIYQRIRLGLAQFGKNMRDFLSAEAVVVATESRTSAPIRIPREPSTLMHPEVAGLFPCGEGAGYAGGIISAAMDGQKVARAVSNFLYSSPFS
jgi:uncharacterized FAD-dependent dehydrogenase